MFCSYKAEGGGSVSVPKILDPYEILGISRSTSFVDTKMVLRQQITQPRRQVRALASLAYHMITSTNCRRYLKHGTHFEIQKPDIFFFAAIGYTEKVIDEISKNPSLLDSVDELKRTVLYLAARCGFYDTTKALIGKGASVNQKQAGDSTPLHGAAFYGHSLVVKLLLVHGADPSLKNKLGSTPADESSAEMKQIFENFEKDPISIIVSTLSSFTEENVLSTDYAGKVIAREVFRSKKVLNSRTNNKWDEIYQQWEVAFHGTKFDYLESIVKYGLLPSGAKLPNGEVIKPPSNHVQLGKAFSGISDWAKAIFVSPSVLYAAHAQYSERIPTEDSQWCVVLKVLIKPSSYDSFNPTVIFEKMDGEPNDTEYRVKDKDRSDSIFRIFSRASSEDLESSRNVVVQSVLFIDLNFLENLNENNLRYEDVRKLFTQ